MLYFAVALVVSALLTVLIRRVAERWHIMDQPDALRKFHSKPVALLGGVALFLTFWGVVGYLYLTQPTLAGLNRLAEPLIVSFFASLAIILIGIIDDIHPIPAWPRLFLTMAVVLIAATHGLQLGKLTNPLGGIVALSGIVGGLFVFFWLMGAMYTIKITDGLDGLSTGVAAIGALMIAALASSHAFYQPNVSLLAFIFAGTAAGFLIFNFVPASVFLGESGSLFLGFMLGILAIISGGKVATAFLVLAIPAFDLARVIYLRLKHRSSPFKGDRLHLHYALLSRGWSERQVVLLFYAVAAAGGIAALLLQSREKLIAMVGLAILMIAVGAALSPRVVTDK